MKSNLPVFALLFLSLSVMADDPHLDLTLINQLARCPVEFLEFVKGDVFISAARVEGMAVDTLTTFTASRQRIIRGGWDASGVSIPVRELRIETKTDFSAGIPKSITRCEGVNL